MTDTRRPDVLVLAKSLLGHAIPEGTITYLREQGALGQTLVLANSEAEAAAGELSPGAITLAVTPHADGTLPVNAIELVPAALNLGMLVVIFLPSTVGKATVTLAAQHALLAHGTPAGRA